MTSIMSFKKSIKNICKYNQICMSGSCPECSWAVKGLPASALGCQVGSLRAPGHPSANPKRVQRSFREPSGDSMGSRWCQHCVLRKTSKTLVNTIKSARHPRVNLPSTSRQPPADVDLSQSEPEWRPPGLLSGLSVIVRAPDDVNSEF